MKILYFPRHGDGAIEMALVCRGAKIGLEISGKDNGLCRANTTSADLVGLRKLGVATPDRAEVIRKLTQRDYSAVLVHQAYQVDDFRELLQSLHPDIPLIVRQSSEGIRPMKECGMRNFISTSQRALDQFPECNTCLKPKLLDWSRLPTAEHHPSSRTGVVSYINHYTAAWPVAYRKFQELNQILKPPVINYGIGSPAGVVRDLATMLASRATVHIKNGGACCFAVVRSMAMGTPVVMDRETWRQGYFDGVDGLLVRENLSEVADELTRLQHDDAYWVSTSRDTLQQAKRQFTYRKTLGREFRKFVKRCIQDSVVQPSSRSPNHLADSDVGMNVLFDIHERITHAAKRLYCRFLR